MATKSKPESSPDTDNALLKVPGFRLAATASGIKNKGVLDLLLVACDPPAVVAGVFTRNQIVAAPVEICRERLSGGEAQGLLVNSGNANACTGAVGDETARELSAQVADLLGAPNDTIFIASTGVIGEPLPGEKVKKALPKLMDDLDEGEWLQAAQAIMTTDTRPKATSRQFTLEEITFTVTGIAKGSGMIHPDMATMLGFIFTDAPITQAALQTLLTQAVDNSFNAITVDGDTSTNDTVLAFSSGLAGGDTIDDPEHPRAAPLAQALNGLCQELAWEIVRDGEGASKFVTVSVTGAKTRADAKQVAMTVAKSPLVKTACCGSDPNWGRIIAAVGYAGVPLVVDRLAIHLGEVRIVKNGGRDPDYTEEQGQAVMNCPEIAITIDLGLGEASATVATCDLTQGYITINADYRS
ncbi:MAG: bifunctional glutamate N-acetyltransferase/amino-acid acetyltransferase ArgJ [Magnetococcales bacterium]|nr:bifunctional glutamate N-acetyltransferase/amino-acid acetyltransferase ArgJ [Magnetococcales bacterium]